MCSLFTFSIQTHFSQLDSFAFHKWTASRYTDKMGGGGEGEETGAMCINGNF